MNKLIIAEKPMLARDIARVLCGTQKIPARGNGYTVVSCAGHLLELCDPADIKQEWSIWSLEILPIQPKPWPKKISKGKKELVDIIKKELKNCSSVINAGDPDDEGQLIVDEVLDYLGYHGRVERVYINDSIDKNIKNAFKKLINNESCKNISNSALGRQIADYTFGVNESRLACLRLNQRVSIGRVQTPTLGLVVNRDRAIQNHTVRSYYELFADSKLDDDSDVYDFKFSPAKRFLEEEKYIFDKDKLVALGQNIPDTFCGKTVISQEIKHPPLPFNLTKLQSACSKSFGISAKTTLNITQDLRDKYKAITYNRTDCQYLSEEHYKDASNVVEVVLKNLDIKDNIYDLGIKHKAFNDKNVSAHHAIIPQEISLDIGCMSDLEQKVYKLICMSYLRLFLPPQKLSVSTTEVDVVDSEGNNIGSIKYVAKKVIDAGWKQGNAKDDDTDVSKPWLDSGENQFRVYDRRIEQKETKPPKYYTEGTLIADMASIAKYVEDKEIKEILKKKDEDKKGEHGGIGTTATRADIIEKLKTRKFIEKHGKQIRSTKFGQDFYDIIPKELKKADVTAEWWLLQEKIQNGELDEYAIADDVIKKFREHQGSAYRNVSLNASDNKVVGVCPKCGEDVIERGKIYTCISNKSKKTDTGEWKQIAGCGFKCFQSICGKKLKTTDIKKILSGETVIVKDLKSKAGNKFDAGIKLGSEDKGFYKFELVFNNK